jgi:hypothetical protein
MNVVAITTLMERNNLMKSMIVTGFIFAIVLANVNLLAKVTAETGVGKDVFKVIVTLFGITNSTKDIVTIVNVNDQTKIKLFNAQNPESQDQDKVSYIMTFPNLTVNDGDPYTVCTIKMENFKVDCTKGKNSPLSRPEFVDVDVSKGSSEVQGGSSEVQGGSSKK